MGSVHFLSFAQGSLVQVFAKEIVGEEKEYWEAEVGGACTALKGQGCGCHVSLTVPDRSVAIVVSSPGQASLSSTLCAIRLSIPCRTHRSWHCRPGARRMTPQHGTAGDQDRRPHRMTYQQLRVGSIAP